jgi:GNAT superfamily N-acetyltransferase
MTNSCENIIIRRATEQDLSVMVFLLEILFSIEKDFIFDALRQERGLQLMLANRQAVVLVAERKERVIGMCTGQLLISTAQGGWSVAVEDVVVLPEQRGKGVGGRLVAVIADWAAERGANRVQLLADRNNAKALGFYSRIGYAATNLICLRKMNGEER